VVVADVDRAAAEMVAGEIAEAGGKAVAVAVDVRKAEEVEGMVRACAEAFGRVDVAFNNAGVEGVLGPLAEVAVEAYDAVMEVNVRGVFLCLRAELARMLEQAPGANGERGAIVNCASVGGQVGLAGAGLYSASKHAVLGLTQSAALEVAAAGIRVNAVCPGFVDTAMADRFSGGSLEHKAFFAGMHPAGRLGRTEEVARAVLWLASGEAGFVTGTALAVDGGYLAR
jgi:NAD(P)-dependent dehydrogenase (short-subunit alcohol dehydrogenase family)